MAVRTLNDLDAKYHFRAWMISLHHVVVGCAEMTNDNHPSDAQPMPNNVLPLLHLYQDEAISYGD